MNRLVLLASLVVCAILQAVLPSWSAMGQAKAPLLLGGVLYYALTRDSFQVVEAAVLAGILQDSLGPMPLGFTSLAFCVVALLTNHYRDRVFGDHWITHVLLGMAAAILVTFMQYLMLVGGGHRVLQLPFVLSKALGMSILGVVVIPLVFKLIENLDYKLGNVELREG